MTKSEIKKHLEYLSDYSKKLLSEHYLNELELDSLKIEFEKFVLKLKQDPKVDAKLLEKLAHVNFSPRLATHPTFFDKLFRRFRFLDFRPWDGTPFAIEHENESAVKDAIRDFDNQISHLLFSLNTYKLSQ